MRYSIDATDINLSNIGMVKHTLQIARGERTFCAPNWHWHNAPHHDTGFNLWFITAGEGTLETSQSRYVLHPGDCFLLRLWDVNIGEHNPQNPLVVSWICFDCLDARGRILTPDKCPALQEHRRIPELSFFDQVLQRAIHCHAEGPERAAEALHWLQAALFEVMQYDRQSQRSGLDLEQHLLVERLCAGIREHPEAIATLRELAVRAGCSVDHLIRLFRRYKGVTPWEFVIRCRIERSGNLLRFSSHSIAQIAELLGYADIYSFSKQFKVYTGQAPSHYRRHG